MPLPSNNLLQRTVRYAARRWTGALAFTQFALLLGSF